jgi:hypothetical protein
MEETSIEPGPAGGEAPAIGAAGVCPARCAAKITTSVTNARPPRIQGRLLAGAASTFFARTESRLAIRSSTARAPTGAPQSWQNFAPGVSDTPQAPQRASRTTAPHCVQKRPAAGAPQDGQGTGFPELTS